MNLDTALPDTPGYQLPPAELVAVVDAPQPPALLLSPRRDRGLLVHRPALPGIAELAQPELRLAGLRIHTRHHGASRSDLASAFTWLALNGQPLAALSGLPEDLRAAVPRWSPDQAHIAFTRVAAGSSQIELWLIEVASGQARRLALPALNAVTGAAFEWMPDGRSLLVRLRSAQAAPQHNEVPNGPSVQACSATPSPRRMRTFGDLIRDDHDSRLLEHYLGVQLARVDLQGTLQTCGAPCLLLSARPSPDGTLLLVDRLRPPFSRLVQLPHFAHDIEVWDLDGKPLHQVASLPACEGLHSGHDAVPCGPRGVHWRTDAPATLAWVEAQDGGDPGCESAIRDSLLCHPQPFEGPPRRLLDLPLRFGYLVWGDAGHAIVTERWWRTRTIARWWIAPDLPEQAPRCLLSASLEDRYASPGEPATWTDPQGGERLLLADDDCSFWTGPGASPEGERPFVDRWCLRTGERTRLFRSEASAYEEPVAPLDTSGLTWLTRRERPHEPPNYCVRVLGEDGPPAALTRHPHPLPAWREVQRRRLHYTRADGVALSATLLLPPGHDPARDGPLPLLMWAYPMEFQSVAAAGQVSGSPWRFKALSWWGPEALVTQGYAVLDDPSMPVIGSREQPANDSFVTQLVANAQAAVDEVVRLGVAERGRIAVGGHSFGAFMVANLLAHSRLFAAGIARSGAYNRSLTPFGFQSEERHFWQAREMYRAISAFDHADRIQAPLLLIHGQNDGNSGTFPLQSERMFAALRGLGKTARLVLLPCEDHRYAARESVLHMLAETLSWLQRCLGPAGDQSSG